jgi:hypothetical protein
MKYMCKGLPLLSLAAVMLLLAACDIVKIADINHDPGRYYGKEINISGQVANSFGVVGHGVFQVDDGSGRIWVLSEGFGVPNDGARCTVKGIVQQGVTFYGRSFGNSLRQTQRRHDY